MPIFIGTVLGSFIAVVLIANLLQDILEKYLPYSHGRPFPLWLYIELFFGPFISMFLAGTLQSSRIGLDVRKFIWPLIFISIIFWAIALSGMFSDGILYFFLFWLFLVITPWTIGCFFGVWLKKKRT